MYSNRRDGPLATTITTTASYLVDPRYQPVPQGPFSTHGRAPEAIHAPLGRWAGMQLIYGYYFMYAFVFSVTIPTSEVYVERVTGNPTLSGPLIATFNFGGVVMQPLQAFLLRRLGIRWSYAFFCTFFVAGSAMYVLAHRHASASLLFAGRAISGACSGTQLFFEVVHRTMHKPEHRREAVAMLVLAYSGGYAFALVCATLVNEQVTSSINVDVNALTVPGILSATLAALVGGLGVLLLRDPPPASGPPPSAPAPLSVRKPTGSLGKAILAMVAIVVLMVGEGLRQVAVFNVSILQWRWDLTSASLFALLAMVIHIPTMGLDHLVAPWALPLLMVGNAPLTLAFAPWGIAPSVAPWLYMVASFLYGPLTRISFSLLSAEVLAYSTTSRYPKAFVQGLAGAAALGVGLGASAATLWDLSRVPFFVTTGLYVVTAGLVWFAGRGG